MIQKNLYLQVPTIHELDYYRLLMSDPNTMNYNKGYGLDGTGCYIITNQEAVEWYNNWLSVPNRYFAYIIENESNTPVGDVNIHYDKNFGTYMIGIVIEAKHRGKGYASQALVLLADIAFYQLELDEIADTFSSDRLAAERAFAKVGFVRRSDDFIVLTKENYINKAAETCLG